MRSEALLLALGLAAGCGLQALAAPVDAARGASAPRAAKATKVDPPIDVNSATRAQLLTLPGIGNAEADRIVAGRPYLSKADLASKRVIPTGVYLSLKGRVIAKQDRMPTPKQ
jgi:DNA uptake protein ComE-like DNA-binding protein